MSGTNLVSTFIRGDNKPALVILAKDASENTKKLSQAAGRHHKVRICTTDFSMDQLSDAIGASYYISCIAVLDKGFAELIDSKLDEREKKEQLQGV